MKRVFIEKRKKKGVFDIKWNTLKKSFKSILERFQWSKSENKMDKSNTFTLLGYSSVCLLFTKN